MNPTRLFSLLLVSSFLGLSMAPQVSHAKKNKKSAKADDETAKAVPGIKKIGIDSLDEFFTKVDAVDQKVRGADTKLGQSRRGLKTGLGLAEGVTLKDGLLEFKTKAGDQVTLGMEGGKPAFTVADAAPEDIKNGVEALKSAVDNYTGAIADLAALPAEIKGIQEGAKAVAESGANDIKAAGVTMDTPKQLKALAGNLKTTASLPDRTADVVKRLDTNLGLLVTTFGGTWPPELGKE